jgi:hypothetical protein
MLMGCKVGVRVGVTVAVRVAVGSAVWLGVGVREGLSVRVGKSAGSLRGVFKTFGNTPPPTRLHELEIKTRNMIKKMCLRRWFNVLFPKKIHSRMVISERLFIIARLSLVRIINR